MKRIDRFLYGGDYNPDQWEEKDWEKDLDYLKGCGINSVTVNVFSWAALQPEEESYDFLKLDKIIRVCEKAGMDIVLGTSTAAMPAWMVQRYPEVSRVDFNGRKRRFGKRHNACPNSQLYRKYAALLVKELAQRYGNEKSVKLWHINNEYGGACFCEKCEKAFQIWLRKRYGTLKNLNDAWNTAFWSHTIYHWDEIVVPNALSEANAWDDTSFEGISVDYRRFMSESLLQNYINEKEMIRRYDKETPVTTNLMGTYKTVDYFRWGKEMDVVSWDNYPSDLDPKSLTAMKHDLMRGLKSGRPFLIMEQNPTQQTFVNFTRKEPGKMRALSYQAMAHGADGLLFFQLKSSRGACEKYCGSVIGHAGYKDTRVYREVKRLGEELERNGSEILEADSRAEAAVLFDWESYWSIEYDRNRGTNRLLDYVEAVHYHYKFFYDHNIPVDVIGKEEDLSKYKIILAPCMYMIDDGFKKRLTEYVALGGTLIATYFSGMVDESTNVILGGYPGGLREILGIWVEEMDYLGEHYNQVAFNGRRYRAEQQCDLIHTESADPYAVYCGEDYYYFNMPAVTVNKYEAGSAYYIGTRLEPAGYYSIMSEICTKKKIAPLLGCADKLEICRRHKGHHDYYFVINFQKEPVGIPEPLWGKRDILSDRIIDRNRKLSQFDVAVVKVNAIVP